MAGSTLAVTAAVVLVSAFITSRGARAFLHRGRPSSPYSFMRRHYTRLLIALHTNSSTDSNARPLALKLVRIRHNETSSSLEQELNRFYQTHFSARTQQAPPRPKDTDTTYLFCQPTTTENESFVAETTIAALRLSPTNQRPPYAFLRGVCVSTGHRRRGLASRLLRESLADYVGGDKGEGGDMVGCYCLADRELTPLYEGVGFSAVDSLEEVSRSDGESITRPKWIWQRFQSMARRVARNSVDLVLLVWVPPASDDLLDVVGESTKEWKPLKVVLIQHKNELSRKTATAPLLLCMPHSGEALDLSKYLTLARWTWAGRDDNLTIEQLIQEVRDLDGIDPVLLWTGGLASTSKHGGRSATCLHPTYIILDGTWQEAKSIFRKVPCLRALPRLSLQPGRKSEYKMRNDFTGWRQRFGRGIGKGDNGDALLCTAEVVAALLDQCSDETTGAGDVIRARLDDFQRELGK